MTRSRMFVFLLALVVAAPVFAQTTAITGDWDVTINSPQGANTSHVTFTQDGEKVTGLFKSAAGELPFTGTLTGSDLKMAFSVSVQGMALDITLTGKVEGETMAGKADFGGMAEGDWTAKRAVATTATTTASTPASSTTATTPTTSTPTTASTTTAGSFAGKWDVMLKTPAGDFPANATITDDGSGNLKGTFGSQMGEVEVAGTAAGKAMKIEMTAVTPQGPMKVVLTGDLQGDEIVNGKAEVEGMGQMEWSAKRAKQ
jgi:hypothetical protein